MSTIHKYLLTILKKHEGLEQRISSKDLQYRLNILQKTSNRNMRVAIEQLRATPEGCRIVSTTKGGGGYFWASSNKELIDHLQSDENRCRNTWIRIAKQKKASGLSFDKAEQKEFDFGFSKLLNKKDSFDNHYDYY